MAKFGQLILTSLGIAAQYNSQAGKQLKFKRIGMGSGKYSGDVSSLTKLISENVSIDISKGYMRNGVFVVEGLFSNQGLQTGFAWREIGLFIEDEKGKEVLYCYANAGDSYDYIPATADERYSKNVRIATAISNSANISIVENEGLVCVDVRTFDATVEELRTDISALWPSKITSGKSCVVKDGAALPFVGMKICGKIEQIKTSGKNLLNIKDVHPSTTSSVSWEGETLTVTGYLVSTSVSGLAAGETYTLSYNSTRTGSTGGGFAIEFKDGSGGKISGVYEQNKYGTHSYSFKVPSGSVQMVLFLYASNSTSGTTSATYANVQIELGSTATAYEPYSGGAPSPSIAYPQDVVLAGADGEVEVKVCGKNLLDISKVTKMSYEQIEIDGNKIIIAAGSNIYGVKLTEAIPTLEVGKTYTFRCDDIPEHGLSWGYRYKTASGLWSNTNNSNTWSFKVTEPIIDINFYVGFNLTFTEDIVISNLQCEIGESATEYEEYREQIMAISTPNGLAEIDGVYDEKDFERGICTTRIKGVELTGTESWNLYNSGETVNQFYAIFKDALAQQQTMNAVSNMFRGIPVSQRKDNFGTVYTADQSGTSYVCFNTTDFTTVQEWKEFLAERYAAGSPVKVWYKLATPITSVLPDSEIAAFKALASNNPNTTILTDSGAEATTEYVTQSHEGLVGMLIRRISELENTIGNINAILESVNGGE